MPDAAHPAVFVLIIAVLIIVARAIGGSPLRKLGPAAGGILVIAAGLMFIAGLFGLF